jgi:hypothetical protein
VDGVGGMVIREVSILQVKLPGCERSYKVKQSIDIKTPQGDRRFSPPGGLFRCFARDDTII